MITVNINIYCNQVCLFTDLNYNFIRPFLAPSVSRKQHVFSISPCARSLTSTVSEMQ